MQHCLKPSNCGDRGVSHPQESSEKEEKPSVQLKDEPIVIEEEEELHLTLKKEESFDVAEQQQQQQHQPQQQQQVPGPQPEWQQISEVLHAKLAVDAHSDAHFIPKKPYLPHRWDQSKPTVHVSLPDSSSTSSPSSRVKDSLGSHGGRVGKVLPMCKQEERECVDLSADKDDYGPVRRDLAQPPAQPPAYCKAGQVVMSPLAKKKLLSQVCESNPYSFTTTPPLQPAPPTAAPERAPERRVAVEEESVAAGQKHSGDGVPEVAPVFRPSVIQHAAARPPAEEGGEASEVHGGRPSHPLKVKRPWQPYLPRPHSQDGGEGGEALVQGPPAPPRSYTGDCYSSPHLHSLYRQTESCLGQERVERQGHLPPRGAPPFALEGGEGLAFRSHYGQRTPEDEPRDYSVSKPLAQRGALSSSSSCSSFPRPPFPSLPYPPLLAQGLDSHPKACRVSPMKPSIPSQSSPESSPESSSPFNPKGSAPPVPLGKRGLVEVDGGGEDESPERKVRVVTPVHPAGAARRGDPEELKPAGGHLPEGHPGAPAYPQHHTAPFFSGVFPAGGLLSPDALQQQHHHHQGLQYLKSQSAVSPLVPPLAFHSMMLHRHLLASGAAPPHHFYRHPGGAALYGDLLHHLYPLSTLPPPQLSSVHPSTRL